MALIENNYLLIVFLIGLSVATSSCLVKHPEYANYEDVTSLEAGMSFEALSDSLGIEPSYIKEDNVNGYRVYVYKYRLCEIKRVPIIMRRNTGIEVEGDFVDLMVTVDPSGTVVNLETCTDCTPSEIRTTVIDFDSLVRGLTTMVTVTLPALLVFLSS